MTSPLLALFIRSLREDSRLKFTYFARSALVLLILLFLGMTKSEFGWTNAPGLQFFEVVAEIDLCFVLLAGVSYFAAPISEEKEEQTLGLLRMTDLNPLSILLGKSTSRLCVAVLLFAAQFPFTLLAITLGGITLRQIVAVYLAIGAFLIFVSGLALLASVICRRTGTAGVMTGACLLLLIFIGPVAEWMGGVPAGMGWMPTPNRWGQACDSISRAFQAAFPMARIEDILLGRALPGSPFLSAQFLSNALGGLACFLLAWLAFGKFCDERGETAPGRFRRSESREPSRYLRPGRAWRRALAWKEFSFTNGGKRWIGIKMVAYGVLLVLLYFIQWYDMHQYGITSRGLVDYGPLAFSFAIVCLVAELAFAAGTIFRNEHQGQTLSSLAMLPQGIRRVAYQKLLGLVPALGASSLYLMLSLPLYVAWYEQEAHHPRRGGSDAVLGSAFYLAQVLFFLHLVAALSLRLKRGALPLAIGVEVLFFIFLTWLFGATIDEDAVVILITLVALAAAGFLHASILWRLDELAGEG